MKKITNKICNKLFSIIIKVLKFTNAFLLMFILFLCELVILYCTIENNNRMLLYSIITISVLCLLGFIGKICVIPSKNGNEKKVIVSNIENKTTEYFFNYFSLFVLLFLSFDFTKLYSVILFFIVVFIIGVVYCCNDLFYINPTITCIGYRIYKIEYMYNGERNQALCIGKKKLYIKDKINIYASEEDCSLYIKEG